MRQAGTSSWNTSMEMMMMWYSGGVTLLKYHVRQVYGVNLEPRQWRFVPRSVTSTKVQDAAASTYPKKTRQAMRNELGPRWSTCSSTSKNRVTLLCNVNRAEKKGTATLDEDQGESSHSNGRPRHRERIRSSRAPEPRSTVGPCLSNSFSEILRITRR